MTSFLVTLAFLLSELAYADWRNTVNKAGEQMILSEKMTKEFCLIAAGKDVARNKVKLLETIDTFQEILDAMMAGDASQNIVQCNTPDVVQARADIKTAWLPYKDLLLNNMNTIRRADGSTDMEVLQAVSQSALPVHDASALLLSRLMIQANAALKYMPSVIEDLLFRQRTIIQRLAKGLLLLSQGVDVLKNIDEFGDTIILFETSLRGILRGVPFAGLPVMTQLCPMIQMAQVTRFYQDVRPLLSATLSASGVRAIQEAAIFVVDESVMLMEILFTAMMDAARLIMENENSCQPWLGMTGNDWFRFMEALSRQRLLIQRITQEVMQVAVQVNAKAAQVEIIVHKAQAEENFRNMIEGNWIKNIPPAGTQRMLKHLQDSWIVWQSMDMEVTEVVQLDEVSAVLIARVFRSSKDILFELEHAMMHGLEMTENISMVIPGPLMNMASNQAVLVSKITELACSISGGGSQVQQNWDLLNASRAQLLQNKFIMLQGTQGNDTSVPKATNVCLVQKMKRAMDMYDELDQEALRVAFGDSDRLVNLVTMAPPTVDAFDDIAQSLSSTCQNETLADEEWRALHEEMGKLAILSQAIPAEFVLVRQGQSFNEKKLDSLLVELETAIRRVMFGSSRPPLAAPPKQSYFDYMLQMLEPATKALASSSRGTAVQPVLDAGNALKHCSRTLQEQFLNEVQDATWPGQRVDLALQQIALAYEVFKDGLLAVLDMAEHDVTAMNRFENQHNQLAGLAIPARTDLQEQWDRVDVEWRNLRSSLTSPEITRTESALFRLVDQLEAAVPLYNQKDIQEDEKFPWAICIYALIGSCILCCCCAFVLLPCVRSKNGAKKDDAKHDEQPAAEVMEDI